MQNYVKTSQYFADKSYLFYFKCMKNWQCAGTQDKVFQVTVSLLITFI